MWECSSIDYFYFYTQKKNNNSNNSIAYEAHKWAQEWIWPHKHMGTGAKKKHIDYFMAIGLLYLANEQWNANPCGNVFDWIGRNVMWLIWLKCRTLLIEDPNFFFLFNWQQFNQKVFNSISINKFCIETEFYRICVIIEAIVLHTGIAHSKTITIQIYCSSILIEMWISWMANWYIHIWIF